MYCLIRRSIRHDITSDGVFVIVTPSVKQVLASVSLNRKTKIPLCVINDINILDMDDSYLIQHLVANDNASDDFMRHHSPGHTMSTLSQAWSHHVNLMTSMATPCPSYHNPVRTISQTWPHVNLITIHAAPCQTYHNPGRTMSILSILWLHHVHHIATLAAPCQPYHNPDRTMSSLSQPWLHHVNFITTLAAPCQPYHNPDRTMSTLSQS